MDTVQKLREGLKHFDRYRPVPTDDSPVMAFPHDDDCVYEFAHSNGQLSVGDLRDLLTLLEKGTDDGK